MKTCCSLVVAAFCLGSASGFSVQAEEGVPRWFIRPGVPRVPITGTLIHPRYNALVPSAWPVIHPGRPKVYPGYNLINPLVRPYVPSSFALVRKAG